MIIALLYGGKSSEHEVSLHSATSILRNIDKKKHKIILVGITKQGEWFLQHDTEIERVCTDLESVLSITEDKQNQVALIPNGSKNAIQLIHTNITPSFEIDIVFPALHGTYSEDGCLQGLLEIAEIPYCGCSPLSSAIAMDKEKTKEIWQQHNLPVLPHICVHKGEYLDDTMHQLLIDKIQASFGFPVFIKPARGGSSVGTHIAENSKTFEYALNDAFLWDNKILIEPYKPMREIECSVTGNSTMQTNFLPQAYTLGEIIPHADFYDYDAKYINSNGANLVIPAKLSTEDTEQIKKIAKKAYEVLNCTGFSRVDFFKDKTTGALYLNEINTLPGFTSISMFPKMCEYDGVLFPDLLELILKAGLECFLQKTLRKTSI